ncbi:NAD-dependent epimerase/dehydratase family protein [Roseobacter sp. MH60115]|uniref:NAD-dependent epimerase/dehydratase family protein n=1 Tax=Roseobacter sp. MH60115 TaxID=2785324 RepID=UPI0018A2B84C|nr:NAD-dependent epimerase/dehydratase family protein [Roseobacter sp. MH60115]
MTGYRTLVTAADIHPDTRAFFEGRDVLVLGGSGFIGSHVVEQLLQIGAHPFVVTRQKDPVFLHSVADQIKCLHGDLTDKAFTKDAMARVSVVMNLAANVAGLEYNATHPASIFMDNLSVFMSSISAAAEAGIDRYLVTSSACVYPRHCSVPTPETEGFMDEPEPTNAGYGWAKRMEEFLGAATAQEYGLSVAIGRPYNAYGPRDNFDPASSHVIPALIRKALLTDDDTFDVWGDGTHSRDFLYVDDFARGLIEVAARFPKAEAVNLGAAMECTIREVATIIAEEVSRQRGRSIVPTFNPQGLTGQPRRACDTTKAQTELGYKAAVPLRTGLRRTIEWYVDNENCTDNPHAK